MIIYFSPEYLGNEYVGFKKEDDIRLDVQYLGIEGLVDFLQMQVGMHWTVENHVVRLSKYYKAMKTFNKYDIEEVRAEKRKMFESWLEEFCE